MTLTGPTTAPQLLTVPEACQHLRISRWALYRLINARQLHTLTIGRRRFVEFSEIEAFLRRRAAAGAER